jgi:tetratricopeptide (TPR) repeat protein
MTTTSLLWRRLVVVLGVAALRGFWGGTRRQYCLAFSVGTTTARRRMSRQLLLHDTDGDKTVDSNPSAQYWHELGTALRRQNKLAQAAEALGRAVALQQEEATASQTDETTGNDNDNTAATVDLLELELGEVYASMGYIDEAVQTLGKVVSREEQQQEEGKSGSTRRPSRACVALANVKLDGLGQKEEALAVFAAACSVGRPSPLALLAGVTADSMGDHEAAEAYHQSFNGNLYSSADSTSTRNTTTASNLVVSDRQVDPETALHLMLSRIRRGDETGAERLRERLLDHYESSADYVLSTSVRLQPSMHYFTFDMIQLALQNTADHNLMKDGLILEFGVYHGKTIRMIASHFPNETVHGFDTFSGIPEDWHNTPRGAYSTHGSLPKAPATVQYHVGTFAETLPEFLHAHPGQPIRFMNIDCDLYSSTKDVLDAVFDRVVPGTIIMFDEYVLNPHWKEDEYRAFQEAVESYGWQYEYLGISLASQQGIVRIL